jgi:DNA-binding PadR family transcriptional regulator
MTPSDAPQHLLPLSPLDLHVLMVLAGKDLYGYAIMKAVEEESAGALAPEIGSLYRVLARLQGTGLVREADAPGTVPETHRGRPRKYYGITPLGLRVLRAETERLSRVVDRARTLLPDGGRP